MSKNVISNYILRTECDIRTQAFMNEIKEVKNRVDNMCSKLEITNITLTALPERLVEKFDKRYVSKESFAIVQKIVYGLVGVILLWVLNRIINLI